MRIPIDSSSTAPLYRQIQDFLRDQISQGLLEPGAKLPSTRRLAKDLGISRITVKNAYLNLESEGLITSWEGSGTYVMVPIHSTTVSSSDQIPSWPAWQRAFESDDHPESQEDNRGPEPVDMISFTGVGDSQEYPILEFTRALKAVIRRQGEQAFNYGAFDGGYLPLRATLAQILASQGVKAPPENVLITSGSQQALSLICQTLLNPGDVVIVEKPTYNLALDLFRALNLKIVGVPLDEEGMQVDRLETILNKYSPRLIYTIPNFQNPSGVCLSGTRRRQLANLADRFNVPIVEDDFVGDLRYDGRALPAVKALDPGGRVIYIGTFSKMLMPGLRMGYLVAEGPVYAQLVKAKRVRDLTSSPLLQRTLYEFVTVGRYQMHLRRSIKRYRKRRDAVLAAITEFLPEVHAIRPSGGLFVWAALPEGYSSRQLLPLALEQGTEYAPGDIFFPYPAKGLRYLRLNFATQSEETIREGIQRLAAAFSRMAV
jgi:GntR family transcriptional regulator/MocR family aminotransferase